MLCSRCSGTTGRGSRPHARSCRCAPRPGRQPPAGSAGPCAASSATVVIPHARQGLLGLLPHSPQGADGQRAQEVHGGLHGHEHQPVRLGVRRRQLGHELVPCDADRAVTPCSASIRRRSSAPIAVGGPSRRRAPLTSRNASSTLICSTSGVTSLSMPMTERGHVVVRGCGRAGPRWPAGTAGAPASSASPTVHAERACLVGGRQHAPRAPARRRSPAGPAARGRRASSRTRRTRPCRRAGSSSRTRPTPSPACLPLTAARWLTACSGRLARRLSTQRSEGRTPRPTPPRPHGRRSRRLGTRVGAAREPRRGSTSMAASSRKSSATQTAPRPARGRPARTGRRPRPTAAPRAAAK